MIAFLKRIWRMILGGQKPQTGPLSSSAGAPAKEFKKLACLENTSDADPVVVDIKKDLEGKASILELMKDYLEKLEGELDNDAPTFAKLARLFDCGATPDRVEGHHYGIALGLRTGDNKDVSADYRNLLGFVWSTSLGKVPPWVGKTFKPITGGELRQITAGAEPGTVPTCQGINHFNEIEDSPLNITSVLFLTLWMNLQDAPENERAAYGYEKVGGRFIARRARSVYHGTGREVFQLNYRWPKLSNPVPLKYLIDEIVEISAGLYLGQLLFATRYLLQEFDPALPDREYDYQHFGYFLLMDESWKAEIRRVFPNIGIPYSERPNQAPQPEKFTSFTFAEPLQGNCRDHLLAEIRQDMKSSETILDLLKSYSDQLMKHPDVMSPYFEKLLELFNRGLGVKDIKGFYRGALLTARSEGLLNVFNINTLNVVWSLARLFTPWTGKSFEDIEAGRLGEITGGKETGALPTCWGANTYSLRTTRKRIAGQAMKAAGIWTDEASADEKRLYEFDMKSFFFIGRPGISVNEDNLGKSVFQINYRWPNLRTFPPDNYCIDEAVQIADGLYLGQLNYATNLLKKYDPAINASEYKYRCFGYFVLMDEDWHKRRLKIGFDLDNI